MRTVNIRQSLIYRALSLAIACLFLADDLSSRYAHNLSNPADTNTLAAESAFNPFLRKTGIDFRNIALTIAAAGEIRDRIIRKDLRSSHIVKLNRLFVDGGVSIETDIKSGILRGSGREYPYAIFRYRAGDAEKEFHAIFISDPESLTPAERAALGEPAVAGVFFAYPDRSADIKIQPADIFATEGAIGASSSSGLKARPIPAASPQTGAAPDDIKPQPADMAARDDAAEMTESAAIGEIWHKAVASTSVTLRIADQDEVLRRLKGLGAEMHSIFRYELAKSVAEGLRASVKGVRRIWIIGSVAEGTAGPESDIDMLINVSSAADRGAVSGYVAAANRSIAAAFKTAAGRDVASMIDVDNKVLSTAEVYSGEGFAVHIRSPYRVSDLLFDRDRDTPLRDYELKDLKLRFAPDGKLDGSISRQSHLRMLLRVESIKHVLAYCAATGRTVTKRQLGIVMGVTEQTVKEYLHITGLGRLARAVSDRRDTAQKPQASNLAYSRRVREESAPDERSEAACIVNEEGRLLREELGGYLAKAKDILGGISADTDIPPGMKARAADIIRMQDKLFGYTIITIGRRHNTTMLAYADLNSRLFWAAVAATARHKIVNRSLQVLRLTLEQCHKKPRVSAFEIALAEEALNSAYLILDAMESMTEARVARGSDSADGLGELFVDGLDPICDYPFVVAAPGKPAFYEPWEEREFYADDASALKTARLRNIKTGATDIEIDVPKSRDGRRYFIVRSSSRPGEGYVVYDFASGSIDEIYVPFRGEGVGETVINWFAERARAEKKDLLISDIRSPQIARLARKFIREPQVEHAIDPMNVKYLILDETFNLRGGTERHEIGTVFVHNGKISDIPYTNTLPSSLMPVVRDGRLVILDSASGKEANVIALFDTYKGEDIKGRPAPIAYTSGDLTSGRSAAKRGAAAGRRDNAIYEEVEYGQGKSDSHQKGRASFTMKPEPADLSAPKPSKEPRSFEPSEKGKRKRGKSKWDLLEIFKEGLAGLPDDVVRQLRGNQSLGERRKLLVQAGLAVAGAIDGKFLISELDRFLLNRPKHVSARNVRKRNLLRYEGKGRELIAYSADDFDFVIKMPRTEEKKDDVRQRWIGAGYVLAAKRLRGLAVPTLVVDSKAKGGKPFTYILEKAGPQKAELAIIQKKVVPIFGYLKELAKAGRVKEAMEYIEKYKKFVIAMYRRGVMDFDFTAPYNNYGIDLETGEILIFDFGDLGGGEEGAGSYLENIGAANKYFYDDLKMEVDSMVADYFAMFPITFDDFFDKSGESLFEADIRKGHESEFAMPGAYKEYEMRHLFANHSVKPEAADLAASTGSGGIDTKPQMAGADNIIRLSSVPEGNVPQTSQTPASQEIIKSTHIGRPLWGNIQRVLDGAEEVNYSDIMDKRDGLFRGLDKRGFQLAVERGAVGPFDPSGMYRRSDTECWWGSPDLAIATPIGLDPGMNVKFRPGAVCVVFQIDGAVAAANHMSVEFGLGKTFKNIPLSYIKRAWAVRVDSEASFANGLARIVEIILPGMRTAGQPSETGRVKPQPADIAARPPDTGPVREESIKVHEENLRHVPDIPEKTVLCHIVADSILPAAQRNMLKALEQDMRDEKYGEKVVALPVDDGADPALFMSKLEEIKTREEARYKGHKVQFDVACPRKDLVDLVQKSGVQALAFTREGDGDVIQVEGIILALRALRLGRPEDLINVYKLITGKDFTMSISDIDELARTMIFIMPVSRLDVNELGKINRLIQENIRTAA